MGLFWNPCCHPLKSAFSALWEWHKDHSRRFLACCCPHFVGCSPWQFSLVLLILAIEVRWSMCAHIISHMCMYAYHIFRTGGGWSDCSWEHILQCFVALFFPPIFRFVLARVVRTGEQHGPPKTSGSTRNETLPPPRFKGQGVQGSSGSGVQGLRGSGVQVSRGLGVQGFRVSGV